MIFETRLNNEMQSIIPSHLVKKYDLEEGDIIRWNEKENGELIISFKKSQLFSKD
ncbi:MAG: hypothetical protein IJJ47_01060 [Methanosphaera sp.]|nr:hypothetical protein [Methanosphaera sp.]